MPTNIRKYCKCNLDCVAVKNVIWSDLRKSIKMSSKVYWVLWWSLLSSPTISKEEKNILVLWISQLNDIHLLSHIANSDSCLHCSYNWCRFHICRHQALISNYSGHLASVTTSLDLFVMLQLLLQIIKILMKLCLHSPADVHFSTS